MGKIDLTRAVEAATEEIYVYGLAMKGTCEDQAADAVRAALPHVIEALADAMDAEATQAQLDIEKIPVSPEWWREADPYISKVRSADAIPLIRALAEEARA